VGVFFTSALPRHPHALLRLLVGISAASFVGSTLLGRQPRIPDHPETACSIRRRANLKPHPWLPRTRSALGTRVASRLGARQRGSGSPSSSGS